MGKVFRNCMIRNCHVLLDLLFFKLFFGDLCSFAANEKIPLLPRLIFWFWLAFGVYTVLRMGQGEDSNVFRFISWNEFYYDMLAKGEVS